MIVFRYIKRMIIKYEKYGNQENTPIIIIHGLFGSSNNWTQISKKLSKDHYLICVDCRNHGHSFHAPSMTYQDMANDIINVLNKEKLDQAHIIGHSMGGKIAMTMSLTHSNRIKKQVIVDIAPKPYPDHHTSIITAMKNLNLNHYQTRSEVSQALEKTIPNKMLRQFLIKNIQSGPTLSWQINLDAISNNYPSIMNWPNKNNQICSIPTLFINGRQSNYIDKNDTSTIKNIFTHATFKTLNTSHWVHAEDPEGFYKQLNIFYSKHKNKLNINKKHAIVILNSL